MGRSPCCSKEGLNKGTWTALEDRILTSYIKAHGEGNWRSLPNRAGLKRCGKSCRLRWLNYLRPDIIRGNISKDEEELIIRLHKLLGNRWSLIAGRLPGRTDNEIKNYWNTILKKRANSFNAFPPQPNQENIPNRSNAQLETLATNQSRPSCESSNNGPLITAKEPQVIRPKPAKCSRVISPMYQFPCHNNQVIINTSSQDFNVTSIDHQLQMEDNHAYEMSFLDFGSYHGLNFLNNDSNNHGECHSAHEDINGVSLVIDEPTVENWRVHTNCDGEQVEEKDPLDLDSLAFFIHADEWP